MKRRILSVVLLVALCFSMSACCLSHDWQEATCTAPKTCAKCGKTEGNPLAHTWAEATCTEPKTCSVCGVTEGEPLGHDYSEWKTLTEATYITDGKRERTCARCGDTVTETIPRLSVDNCKITDGTAMTVTYEEAYYILEQVLSGNSNYIDSKLSCSFEANDYPTIRFLHINGADTGLMVSMIKKGNSPEEDEKIDYIIMLLFGDSDTITEKSEILAWGALGAILVTNKDINTGDEALTFFYNMMEDVGEDNWKTECELEYGLLLSPIGDDYYMLSFCVRVASEY